MKARFLPFFLTALCIGYSIEAMQPSSSTSAPLIDENYEPADEETHEGLFSNHRRTVKLETGTALDQNLVELCYQSAPQAIKDIVFKFQNQKICEPNMPKAVLLYGPEGTGKNTIAKMIAQKANPAMLYHWVHAGALLDTFKNGVEESLRSSIEFAAHINKPCVILIDEVDTLTDSHDNEKDPNHSITATISYILDKYEHQKNIFFVFATNKLKKIPSKLRSRLDDQIVEIPLPDQEERLRAIKYWFGNLSNTQYRCGLKHSWLSRKYWGEVLTFHRPPFMSMADYQNILAKKTDSFSYRRIQQLFEHARTEAEKRAVSQNSLVVTLQPQDFDIALATTKKVESDIKEGYWEKTKQFAKDNPVIAGAIGSVLVAGIGLVAYYRCIHRPQMKQSAAQHKASMAQSAEQHRKSMAQAENHFQRNALLNIILHEDGKAHSEELHNSAASLSSSQHAENKTITKAGQAQAERHHTENVALTKAGQAQAERHHRENTFRSHLGLATALTGSPLGICLLLIDAVTGGAFFRPKDFAEAIASDVSSGN